MAQQPSITAVLQKTLKVLVQQTGLSPDEVSRLHLADLHLAGKAPNLKIPAADDSAPRKIELDLEAHRALVGWLVARPNSVSDHLFVDDSGEPVTPQAIQSVAGAPPPSVKKSEPPQTADKEPATHPPKPPADDNEATMVGRFRPPPARPAAPPPRSNPEAGQGPPTQIRPFPPPPPSVPEANVPPPPPSVPEAVDAPAPAEKPGPSEPPPQPFPPVPEGLKGPRQPPKPVRRREAEADPALVKQKPDQPSLSDSSTTADESSPVVPLSATTPVKPVAAAAPPASAESGQTEGPRATPPEQTKEPSAPEQTPAKPATEETAAGGDSPAPAAAEPTAPPAEKKVAPPPPPIRRPKPGGVKKSRRLPLFPTVVGSVVVLLLLCGVCVGGVGWLLLGDSSGEVLAGLGLAGVESSPTPRRAAIVNTPIPTATREPSPTSEPEIESPLPTPTLPPTHTPTLLPATDTPVPVDTATPGPLPTDTPVPTNTATATVEPTATASGPANTPTPEPSPTVGMKYGPPKLLSPENGKAFTGIAEVKLMWEPVDLAADEQYAVRIVYPFNGQITYGGAQVKEPQWVVPLKLYKQIDPPENRYEWFVVIERLNDDGSGTAISPESERLSFTWK